MDILFVLEILRVISLPSTLCNRLPKLKKDPLMIVCNFTVQKRQALIPFPRTGKRASIQPHKYQDDALGQKLVALISGS